MAHHKNTLENCSGFETYTWSFDYSIKARKILEKTILNSFKFTFGLIDSNIEDLQNKNLPENEPPQRYFFKQFSLF